PFLAPHAAGSRSEVAPRVSQADRAPLKGTLRPHRVPCLSAQMCVALPPAHHGQANGPGRQPHLQFLLIEGHPSRWCLRLAESPNRGCSMCQESPEQVGRLTASTALRGRAVLCQVCRPKGARKFTKQPRRPVASELRLPRMLTVYIDADACPVKPEVYRVA